MYYEFPESPEAYTFDHQVKVLLTTLYTLHDWKWILIKPLCTQYFFGSDILVAPVTQPVDSTTQIATKDIWIPEVRSHAITVNCACFEVKHEDELLHINFLVPHPGYFHLVVFWGDDYWSSDHN